MPLGQHAPFLNRLVRDWLFQAHLFAIDAHATRKAFERRDGELAPGLQYSYFGSVLKEKQETFREKARSLDWDKAATFGGPREVAALQHALRLLRPLTDRLIVVDMPESFLFDDIDRLARAPFEAAIRSSNVEMTEITCSLPTVSHQREFYDEIHLNEIGRERVTKSISKLLSDPPLSRAIDPDEPCAVRVRVR